MKTATAVQKESVKELEEKACDLLKKCQVLTLTSINEKGYPRTCVISKLAGDTFHEIYFETSKRSKINGKATHFENNPKASVSYTLGRDSVTLIGEVEIIRDLEAKMPFDALCNKAFFKQGVADPKHRLLRFRPIEATFWIDGKFKTCKYKRK